MKTYQKFYNLKASPEEVYNALVKPLSIELWSGMTAVMEEVPGSEFSIFEGDITGVNLEFVPNEKIVQEWFFGEEEEKSIVTIVLKSDKSHTVVSLTHTNIPDEAYDNIKEGWDKYYFGALKGYFR
jgi:activator of HSP90 ATPase